MPDQHCPTCGTARSAGCRCLPDPSLIETAVLPHLEGPPLVRPYVPQALGAIADTPPAGVPADPFATTVLPPVPGPDAPPAGPDADAYATTVLPPVMSVPPPGPRPTVEQPLADDGEIGYFPFDRAAPGAPGPAAPAAGRAARRAAEQAEQGMPARRKGLLVAAGAGLLALTVGLAYAVTPSAESGDRAQPAPSTTLVPAPVDPTTPAAPSPSAPPSTEAPSPSPSRTTRPSPSRTAPPSATVATTAPVAAAPPTQAPAAPSPTSAPTPTPTPTPSATPTPTAATPTPTPTFQVLQYGMKGQNVVTMQQKLATVLCWLSVPTNGNFDRRTESSVAYFQVMQGVQGDDSGVYGPNTAAALAKRTTC
ncbi:peptidoglycan-binding domain-containing protein [Kitasatospora sp. NPDC059327]|uniref:peptidoglycan-binding domain-containing protein n=1 Tax=Kitasatospora sp. NPDC059327 TaxID=3346803 RepID=UPI0036CC9222